MTRPAQPDPTATRRPSLLRGGLGLAAASLLAPTAAAQFQHPSPLPDVLVVNDAFGKSVPTQSSNDLYEDQVMRLADFDGDGLYESELETSVLFEFGVSPNKNKSWQILKVRSRVENGVPVVYLSNNRDGTKGASGNYVAEVWRVADANLDGFVDATEATLVADLESIIGGTQGAEGVALTPAGSLWASTDYPGGGLVKIAGGTATVYVDDDLAPYKVPGKFGSPVTIDTDDFTSLTSWGEDGVLVYSDGFSTAKDEAVHGFVDLNGDGDVRDPGEAVCFLNATGANPALLKNPDFGTVLPSMVVSKSQNSYGWLKEMATMREPTAEGELESYFFACNSSNTGNFALNENGGFINGLIFRAVDENGNGHVNDAGEVKLYYDGSGDSGSLEQLDKVLGIDAYEQSLIVFYLQGGAVAICILTDLNGDGDAMDPGERLDPWSEVNVLTPPWNLFFFGVAVGALEPGILPEPVSRQASFSGTGCSQFGGPVPLLTAQGQCKVGSTFFEVQVENAPANSAVWVFLGAGSTYFGQQLPLDLTFLGLPGCTLYQNLAFSWALPTDGAGEASLSFVGALQNPQLAGATFPLQAISVDPTNLVPELGLSRLMTLSVP